MVAMNNSCELNAKQLNNITRLIAVPLFACSLEVGQLPNDEITKEVEEQAFTHYRNDVAFNQTVNAMVMCISEVVRRG